MERCMRQNWDIYRQVPHKKRSQYKKPTCGCWQPSVPSWEKEFCKVVGSLDWEMFLRKKKFVHLFDNVINWDDSEGKVAFQNAKTRFWSEKHGVPCEIPLPDSDLYIDKIDWGSENDFELPSDLDVDPVFFGSDENHEPVVLRGDSFFVNQAFSPSCWGDYEENMIIPTYSSSAYRMDPLEHNWGNAAPVGWTGFCDNAWNLIGGSGHSGYVPWMGGLSDTRGWNYWHNHCNYGVEFANVRDRRANGVPAVADPETLFSSKRDR